MKRNREWIGPFVCCLAAVVALRGETEGAVSLLPSLSVSERYNDNLFFTETNREADYTTMISPGFTLTYESRNLILSGIYRGGASFHARHPEADRYSQAALFNLEIPFLNRQVKGFEVHVTEDVTYTPEPYFFNEELRPSGGDVSVEEILKADSIQLRRTDTFRNRAGVVLGYSWSHRLKSTASYLNIINRYSGEELKNSVVHDLEFGGRYQTTPNTHWITSYGLSMTLYEVGDNVLTHRFLTGAGRRFSPSLTGDGSLGVVTILGRASRLIVRSALSKDFQSGNFAIRYTSSVGTGGGLTDFPSFNQRVFANATWDVGKDVSAYLQMAYRKNTALSGEELRVSSYETGGGMTAVLLSWLSGSLRYSHTNEHVQGGVGDDGKRNLVMLTLTATAPAWRISH